MNNLSATSPPSAAHPRVYRYVYLVLLAWYLGMFPQSWWGLPSRDVDQTLFGGRSAWDSARLQGGDAALRREQRGSGADTDLDPIRNRDQPVDLTSDDPARAAILLRYRLYSRQPDEMITFMALQRMHPRAFDFDPKLYQYGGAYIYLIGAAVGASSLLHFTHLTNDVGYYLARPEEFGKFYVVSRSVTLLFGAATLLAVFRLARRGWGSSAGWLALLFAAISPVFITMTLEAKPHLPSVCLTLWAILAAWDCWEFNRRPDWIRLGLFAGLAFGFVLTGAAALSLPVLVWMLRGATRFRTRSAAGSVALAVAIYAITNPYLVINVLTKAGALSSNLGNSTAMYRLGDWGAGLQRTTELLVESAGPFTVLFAAIAFIWLVQRNGRIALTLSAPALGMLILCSAIGAGKPAEFARFLLLPALLASIACAAGVSAFTQNRTWIAWAAIAILLMSSKGGTYFWALMSDRIHTHESRYVAAKELIAEMRPDDALAVTQEPAPYCTPPIDFDHRRVVLLPTSKPVNFEPAQLPPWLVLTADHALPVNSVWWQNYYTLTARSVPQSERLALITWANKPVFIYQRREPPR